MQAPLLHKVTNALKSLSASDKYLLIAAASIVINPTLALAIALLILLYFVWRIGVALIEEEE